MSKTTRMITAVFSLALMILVLIAGIVYRWFAVGRFRHWIDEDSFVVNAQQLHPAFTIRLTSFICETRPNACCTVANRKHRERKSQHGEECEHGSEISVFRTLHRSP